MIYKVSLYLLVIRTYFGNLHENRTFLVKNLDFIDFMIIYDTWSA